MPRMRAVVARLEALSVAGGGGTVLMSELVREVGEAGDQEALALRRLDDAEDGDDQAGEAEHGEDEDDEAAEERNLREHERQHPENREADRDHDAVLGVPLHLAVLLLG